MKFAISGILALGVLSATAAGAQTLTIGSSADYPPWESVDANNEIVGFDRDFGDELCKRMNVTCTWANQAYDGLLPSLQVGKFDALISGISINAERAAMVDFSIPYADAPNAFAGPVGGDLGPDADKDAMIAALSGLTIGVQSGTTHEQVLSAHFPDVDARIYERPEQIVDDINAGRLDAGLMEMSAWEPFMADGEDNGLTYFGPQLSSADYEEFGNGQGVAIKKDSPLKAEMDAAIASMLADGTLSELSQKWFGYDISFRE